MQSNFYKALGEAQKSLSGISKDAKNNHANYNYVSAEEMVKASRAALFHAGLVAGRKSWAIKLEADGAYNVKSLFFVVHAESGESLEFEAEFPAVMRKGMPQDKAVACALTSCLSYFLRDLLLLPRFSAEENMDVHNDFTDEINQRISQIQQH